jgi:NAD(P)-dependent dehydrogenase (short-subunit alcohol dehydrogenase family)
MKNVLVTGGSRGIGLEFTRQYLQKDFQVFAASRNPASTGDLQKLKTEYDDQLSVYELDVSDGGSRQRLYQRLSEKVEKLDILINNAGIASGNEKFRYQFGELDQGDLSRSFLVNSISPLMMAQTFFPLLERGKDPVIANISSNSGSITRKVSKGDTGYGYSASKSALNMIGKMLAIELKDHGIIVITFHPGWVRTTMLYCENAPLAPVDSISGMISVIETLEMKDSGRFLDWEGNELPW